MQSTEQKLREALQLAQAALSLALSDVEWRKDSPTQPTIYKAYNTVSEALALPTAEVMTNGLTQAGTDASASVSGLTDAAMRKGQL